MSGPSSEPRTAGSVGATEPPPGRPKAASAPEGLRAAAPDLPAQGRTARRAKASGRGTSSEPRAAGSVGAIPVALAGMAGLAVAMGIGRFAFTPLLPLMLHEGSVDLSAASWLASANYLGYVVGALLFAFQPAAWALWARLRPQQAPLPALAPTHMVRMGLVATVLLTAGMALPWPGLWPVLRFAAGVASAQVFVFCSGWCLAQLAARGKPGMGALIYTGPGAGIIISGLAATGLVSLHGTAAWGWLLFAVLAIGLSAAVWRSFHARNSQAPPVTASAMPAAPTASVATAARGTTTPAREGLGLLTAAYSLAGFGYIITATFLPVIARQTLPPSPWLDLFWPLFGLGVVLGALLASRVPVHGDWRWWLAGSYLLQALGVSLSLWWPTLPGFALGSLILGLPFTAITYFAMQEVRRLRPVAPAAPISLLTAAYGIGQIIGPPLASALVARSSSAAAGFDLALSIAASSLVLGAGLYVWLALWRPREQ